MGREIYIALLSLRISFFRLPVMFSSIIGQMLRQIGLLFEEHAAGEREEFFFKRV